jgi:hypothetical protein
VEEEILEENAEEDMPKVARILKDRVVMGEDIEEFKVVPIREGKGRVDQRV